MSNMQTTAYERYQNSTTEGTKQALHDTRAVHPSFVSYMNNYADGDPNSLDTSHLQPPPPFPKESFYRILLTETFHVYWSAGSQAQGPGNTVLVELRHDKDSGNYTLTYRGLTDQFKEIVLESPNYLLSSRSLRLEEGLVKMFFKLTSKSVNGSQVWNHQIMVNGRLYANYDLVSFSA